MTAFLIIGAIGALFLLVSLVLGDFVDGLFEGFGGEVFSGAALGAFLGVFGFVGALVLSLSGDNVVLAVVIGLVAGIAVGAGAGWFAHKLRQGGDNATVRSTGLVGLPGTVISDIPDSGYGEVSIVASGHITKLNARSATPLPAGTSVQVSGVLSATAVMVTPRD